MYIVSAEASINNVAKNDHVCLHRCVAALPTVTLTGSPCDYSVVGHVQCYGLVHQISVGSSLL